jgi:hypothetical protein
MSRALIVIRDPEDRRDAERLVARTMPGDRIEFKRSRRSIPQNARMWAMLTDVARQLPWHGVKLPPDDWKLIFLDALKREVRVVPALDGRGFVNLGRSSSDLSKEEMSDLMELIAAFGTQHGVVFSDPALESA